MDVEIKRPGWEEEEAIRALLAPVKALLQPTFFNMDRIPDTRPLLFVGNHGMYGMLDVPHLFFELLDQKDIFLRSMGDRFHFAVPGWGPLLARWGVVDGDRALASRILETGQSILVFPGGAREVAKRRGEQYQLVWGNRLGFAKLAIRHQTPIVPVAAIGADEAWEILVDAEDQRRSKYGSIIETAYRAAGIPLDSMMPVARGLGPTPVPRPVKLYFSFGRPIDPAPWAGMEEDDHACFALREQVADEIRREIRFLLDERDWDPGASFGSRLLSLLPRRRR